MVEEKPQLNEEQVHASADEQAATISSEELQQLLDHAAKGADELAIELKPVFELSSSCLELKLR